MRHRRICSSAVNKHLTPYTAAVAWMSFVGLQVSQEEALWKLPTTLELDALFPAKNESFTLCDLSCVLYCVAGMKAGTMRC